MNPRSRLAAMAAGLRAGTLEPEDRDCLAEAIERVAAGEDAAAAFGIKRGPGQRAWHTCEALAQRDMLLRHAASCFLGGLSVTEQALRLHVELSRYRASAWARERVNDECPERHRGTIYENLWQVLKLRDAVLGPRSLRLILATS